MFVRTWILGKRKIKVCFFNQINFSGKRGKKLRNPKKSHLIMTWQKRRQFLICNKTQLVGELLASLGKEWHNFTPIHFGVTHIPSNYATQVLGGPRRVKVASVVASWVAEGIKRARVALRRSSGSWDLDQLEQFQPKVFEQEITRWCIFHLLLMGKKFILMNYVESLFLFWVLCLLL